MKKPILLTKWKLLVSIQQALSRIENIRQLKIANKDQIILEGLFVLAVASFETALTDTLRILLTHIPEKLDGKLEGITKEDLIEGEPLQKAIQIKIHSIGYKNLDEIIDYFIKVTDLNENTLPKELKEKLREVKARRNLLIHNNLIRNNIYDETAGKYKFSNTVPRVRVVKQSEMFKSDSNRLNIDQEYLYQSIVILREILQRFNDGLADKYANYTYIRAVQQLWEFMFDSPVMRFKDIWKVDNKKDLVLGCKKDWREKHQLSSSEETLFTMWLAHSRGEPKMEMSSFYLLDSNNRERISYFMSVAELLKENN